VSVIVR